jgi:phosphatidylglycerol:prolipoprotein diacylglycerol transferase
VTLALAFPAIDPIAIQIGPIAIRWYALAYLAALLGGWWYVRWLARRSYVAFTDRLVDDFLVWATLGVVLGGRLGYVLFYKPGYYIEHPLEAVFLWQGGMAFHGGALGVIAAIFLFGHQRKIDPFRIGDLICCAVPIGLFLGRIANFINGELWGRTAPDAAWAMVFPGGGPIPRHPSQLYEAALEGLVLFIVLHLCWRVPQIRERGGVIAGIFLAGYGIARIIGEMFRQPDAHLGFLFSGMTMGQLLSIPMVLAGVGLILWARRRKTA